MRASHRHMYHCSLKWLARKPILRWRKIALLGGIVVAPRDENYFRRRAEQELDLAQRAEAPGAVLAHYQLAEAYLDKLEPDDQEPSLSSEQEVTNSL